MTGVTVNTEEALLVHLLFTACQAAWFLTGQTDAGRGDPCSRQQAELFCDEQCLSRGSLSACVRECCRCKDTGLCMYVCVCVCVCEMLTGKEHEVIWEDEGNVLGSWLQRCT